MPSLNFKDNKSNESTLESLISRNTSGCFITFTVIHRMPIYINFISLITSFALVFHITQSGNVFARTS